MFYFDSPNLDNIDTRKALDTIRECISSYNLYIKSSDSNINLVLIYDIAAYITKILRIFGTIPPSNTIGFPLSSSSSTVDVSIILIEF